MEKNPLQGFHGLLYLDVSMLSQPSEISDFRLLGGGYL